jgi:hypothetical protein
VGADNTSVLSLQIKVTGDKVELVDATKNKIDALQQSTVSGAGSMSGSLSTLKSNWLALAGGVTAGYFAIKGGIDTITDLVNVAAEAEQIESRMAFQLGQVGYKFDEIKPFVDEFAESILKTTRFSDEMARQGLGQMMQYTSDVNQAMRGVKLAMDMSTQSGQDLGSTTRLVGMAMNGNTEIIGRWIPELRDLESKVGANATAAEKWAFTQELLNKKFGGAAQKDLNTYAGQVAQLKNEFDELKEMAGRALKPYAQDWVLGAKSILGDLFPNVGKEKEVEKGNTEEAKRKAAEQALEATAKRRYDLELSMRDDIEKLDLDYQKKFFQLTDDKIGQIRLERDEAIKAAQEKYNGIFTAETAIQKVKDYYLKLEFEQIKKNKEEQVNAMLSLATLWKGYYDDRISKENEIIGLIKGTGIETTVGAKFEFAGIEEQFRKVTEQAGMFTPEEMEKIKAAYQEKLKAISPFAGGEWEEISVATGSEIGPSGQRKTTWGQDWRWRETGMTEEQRRVEAMREESSRRIEGMGAGAATGRPEGIISRFDETRGRVIELQKEIDKIREVKVEVESGKLIDTIKQARDLQTALTDLSNRDWPVNVVVTGDLVKQIEDQIVGRISNRRSQLGPAIRREAEGVYGNE